MAWAAGTFSRAGGATKWVIDRDASTEIEAGIHDTHDEDLATGINQCLNKDGSNAATADLDIGNNKITNVTDPTADQDAATKVYVDTNFMGAVAGDEFLARLASTPSGWAVSAVTNKAVKIVTGTPSTDGGTNTFDVALVNALSTGLESANHTHTWSGTTSAFAHLNSNAATTPPTGKQVTGASHTHTVSGTTGIESAVHAHSHTLGVQHREFNIFVKS